MLGALFSCRPIVSPRHGSALCPTQIHKKYTLKGLCSSKKSFATEPREGPPSLRVPLWAREPTKGRPHSSGSSGLASVQKHLYIYTHPHTLTWREKHHAELKNCWWFTQPWVEPRKKSWAEGVWLNGRPAGNAAASSVTKLILSGKSSSPNPKARL